MPRSTDSTIARGPARGRARTLAQVGRMLAFTGETPRVLRPDEVMLIERRAMAKIKSRLEAHYVN